MECASGFESSYSLLILTLEKELDIEFGGGSGDVSLGLAVMSFGLGSAGNGVDRIACCYRCSVDVWFDAFVGGLYRLPC